ncbi:MAG: hypothetical protein HXY34_14255 [Candidatus Thorarchaeota archaeon]|nr:hypothetical protein [Candidatus Thorarchaeota archaeon]
MFSEKFKEAVRKAVGSEKLIVGVVHWKARDRLIDEVKKREDAEIIEVTDKNRNELHQNIVDRIGFQ